MFRGSNFQVGVSWCVNDEGTKVLPEVLPEVQYRVVRRYVYKCTTINVVRKYSILYLSTFESTKVSISVTRSSVRVHVYNVVGPTNKATRTCRL